MLCFDVSWTASPDKAFEVSFAKWQFPWAAVIDGITQIVISYVEYKQFLSSHSSLGSLGA
jgi:hypothetical protein